ncbi:MAG: uncharacterized protein A8A55_3658, partial [Amphiamblys sp. WSBS2006]
PREKEAVLCSGLTNRERIVEICRGTQSARAMCVGTTQASEPMELCGVGRGGSREARTCFNCGMKGHIAKDCRKPKKTVKKRLQSMEIEGDSDGKKTEYVFCLSNKKGNPIVI